MGRTLSFIVKTAKVRAARSCEYSATNAWNLNLNNGNATNAWNLNLNNGNANNNTKATNQNRVRAVSAPLQIASTLKRLKGYDYYGRIVRGVF
jgi:hypothetical protein